MSQQKLVNICFQLVLTATSKEHNSTFSKMSTEEKAGWVADQLKQCGFPTRPMGSLWGVLEASGMTFDEAREALVKTTRAVEKKLAWIREVWDEQSDSWTELQRLSATRFVVQELTCPIEALWHGLCNEPCPWSEASGMHDEWEPD